MSSNLLTLNQAKTEFLVISLPAQLAEIADPALLTSSNVTILQADSARNLIFDSTLSMSHHIFFCVKVLFLIYPWLASENKKHSRLHNCPHLPHLCLTQISTTATLFLTLPQSLLSRHQLILNSTARDVTKTPKFSHITPALKPLHWLKIEQRIQYKVISFTYKTLQSNKPTNSMTSFTFSTTNTPAPLILSLSISFRWL